MNKLFKARDLKQTGNKPNFFSLLGYEAGMAFFQIHNELKRKNWGVVNKQLKQTTIQSPRGLRSFNLNSKYSTPLINIEKITIDNNTVRKMVIEQGRSLNYNDAIFEEVHEGNMSGWQNPYLNVTGGLYVKNYFTVFFSVGGNKTIPIDELSFEFTVDHNYIEIDDFTFTIGPSATAPTLTTTSVSFFGATTATMDGNKAVVELH